MIRVLYEEAAIAARVRELASEIRCVYAEEEPLYAVVLLNGAMFFAADLLRALAPLPVRYDTFSVSSYSGDSSTGNLNIRSRLKTGVKGKNVLLIDDILDTGLTLKRVSDLLKEQGALRVRTCVLLDKILPDPSRKQFRADWCGFRFDPVFVIGYGLDFDEDYRTLPYIGYWEE